jgi:hypothetical protein
VGRGNLFGASTVCNEAKGGARPQPFSSSSSIIATGGGVAAHRLKAAKRGLSREMKKPRGDPGPSLGDARREADV